MIDRYGRYNRTLLNPDPRAAWFGHLVSYVFSEILCESSRTAGLCEFVPLVPLPRSRSNITLDNLADALCILQYTLWRQPRPYPPVNETPPTVYEGRFSVSAR